MINTTIAHYKITSKLGQGGMGEVYRATDTKLDQDVAIKILPESFAGDKNRVARFKREAKVLATLNHPNIAAIYGIEKTADTHALVMELIKGDTLGERLKREPMTVEEALDCCKQIAEALEAAHEKGIIHRDLKPENIKTNQDGHVKVLDFGLAKEVVDPAIIADQAESPTVTHMTTLPGELLGTAPYMSPEQARAKPVDKRSDIWSFGCVLFECLTGKRMFGGEDVTETLASIIKGEPDWAALPENTPPTIHLLLRKCLNKDCKRRLRDIGDARIDLEQALGDPTSSIIRLSDQALQQTVKHGGIKPSLAIGAVVLVAVTAVVLTWYLKPEAPLPIRHINMDLGMEGNLRLRMGTAARLSPDGSTLAYLYHPEGGGRQAKLYLRRLDELESRELKAAEGAVTFCFSPKGHWIAFRTGGRGKTLKKISVTGGPAIPLCETGSGRGIDWPDDGWIIFAPSDASGLSRISASGDGGAPEPVTTLSGEEVSHRWPQALPGGHVLYTAHSEHGGFDDANIMVQRTGQGDSQVVWRGGYHSRYLPSGHLVFVQQGSLFAAAFDIESLELIGQPSPILDEVAANDNGGAHFDVSADGTLVYVGGSFSESLFKLEWVDRQGNRQLLRPADRYSNFKLSPKGDFLAYGLDDGEQEDIWIYEIERGVPIKLTFDDADDDLPVWSPSGESIVFGSDRDGRFALYWKRLDRIGDEAQRLKTDSENTQFPEPWHPKGRHLSVTEWGEQEVDIRIVKLGGDDSTGWRAVDTNNFRATRFQEKDGTFSPDGDWLAYSLKESEQHQVFVRSFPDGVGEEQISIENYDARRPLWLQTTQELIFSTGGRGGRRSREKQIFSVKYRVEEGKFKPDRPVLWEGGNISADRFGNNYDIDPKGDRLLVRSLVDVNEPEQTFDHVVVFENFFEYLREKVSVE